MNAKLIILLAVLSVVSCAKPKYISKKYYDYSIVVIDSVTSTTEDINNLGVFIPYKDTLVVNIRYNSKTNKSRYSVNRKAK